MNDRLGYVVITYNQASKRPDIWDWSLYDDLDDAIAARDHAAEQTASVGRGEVHTIAEVIELDEEEARDDA